MKHGKLAITLTTKGIDTIGFLSKDKKESVALYVAIEEELNNFEQVIIAKLGKRAKDEHPN